MNTAQRIATHYFHAQLEGRLVHQRHMVGVPTHRTAHMKHDFWAEQKHGAYFVGHNFGRMEVTRVECHYLAVLRAIGQIKIVAAHSISLEADAENLRFEAVAHMVELIGKIVSRDSLRS